MDAQTPTPGRPPGQDSPAGASGRPTAAPPWRHDLADAVVGRLMGDVLQRAPLGSRDDFFLCGGDSLGAVELISRLVERSGLAEDAGDFLRSELLLTVFDNATPSALAAVVRQRTG